MMTRQDLKRQANIPRPKSEQNVRITTDVKVETEVESVFPKTDFLRKSNEEKGDNTK